METFTSDSLEQWDLVWGFHRCLVTFIIHCFCSMAHDCVAAAALPSLLLLLHACRAGGHRSDGKLDSLVDRVALSPHLTEDDTRAVENVATVVEFLVGSGTDSSETFQQVAPLLPEVAAQMLPEIFSRLTSRIVARTLRELYVLPS